MELWNDYLYQPVLNLLFVLYDGFAGESLAIAVVELTVLMRLVLLPLSIIAERKRAHLEELSTRVTTMRRSFKNDPVRQREETRKLFREYRVNPWAKVIALGLQVLVFILLYQVFLGGLSGGKLDALYPSVRHPDVVNTMFLGFDIAQRNVWWAVGVGVLLFIEVVVAQAQRRNTLTRRDAFYRYIFPISVSVLLSLLPMVKSLFILTSMAFSAMLYGVRKGLTAASGH